MNTALSWIKAYVPDLAVNDQEYCDAMTLSGTKVEGYERSDKNLEKIVVGEILQIERHPDADKLIICQVNIGDQTIQIVTGAPNVKVGDKVPVVLDGGKVAGGHDGSTLPEDGIQIKSGKLRGIDSFGMMCSIEELGSSRNMYPEAPEYGIYLFPEDIVPGTDAIELLGLHDTVFEYEITSNRVDCYSILGIAREAAATFKKEFVPPVVTVKENNESIQDYLSVEVKDPELCSRYIARVVKNIKIGPSPKWLQRRLAASGIRPINNLVDITNYVMEEYGQPMHAFDLSCIAGHKIIVKRAEDGEEFMTLDQNNRIMDHDVLMIADADKSIGIAGIMGGENSKISDNVTTVVFESAAFSGVNIRKSAKRLGLRTDASGKFEKGVEPHNCMEAINRACQLVNELDCGEVVGGVIDICEPIPDQKMIAFEPERINRLLGTDVSVEEMKAIFKRIEVELDENNMLRIPYFRQDLEGFADIAEEIARFYGYDKIPVSLPEGKATTGKMSFKLMVEQKVRELAEFCGYSQAMCYSFESPKVFDKLLFPKDAKERQTVSILNPLGEDFSVMRTIPVNGMLTSLSTNFNRRNKGVKLYEIGNIYIPNEIPVTTLPDERMQLVLGMYGCGDFYDMKGVVETILNALGLKESEAYSDDSNLCYLHPGRQAAIHYQGVQIGYLGEVHPVVIDNYGIKAKSYLAVIDMPTMMRFVTFDRKYEGIAKYPAVTRDISMVVPKRIMAGTIESMIRQRGGKILENLELFDLYEGEQIEAGYKSMAYSLSFRDKNKTLDDTEVTGSMKKIMNGLTSLGIELRK